MFGRRLLIMLTLVVSGVPLAVQADNDTPGDHVVLRENKERASFSASITTDDHGVWVTVHGQQAGSATAPAPQAPAAAPASSAPAPVAPASNAPALSSDVVSSVRSWYDPERGYFSESPDGHLTSLQGMPIGVGAAEPGGWYNVGSQQHPSASPMSLWVDGDFQDVVWIPDNPQNVQFGPPPDAPPDVRPNGNGGTDPHDVALDMIAHIPLPDIHLKVNPDLGLAAINEWFWMEGYDGRPFGQSRTVTLPPPAPGLPPTSFTVTVRLWPKQYDWSFGDGQDLITQSIGKAYPQESDIQHVYQHSSFAFAQGYPLWLTVEYGAEFRVNGGAPQPLPAIRHTYQAIHRVQEIQSILDKPKQS